MFHSRFVRLLIGMFLVNLFFGASSSSAWEFSMEGELVWKNRFVGQLGSRGFFGKYDLDNSSTPGNFASVNGWVSGKLNDLSSSSSAADQVMETNVLPELRINSAMRLRGEYRIGAFGDPIASSYTNSTSPGVQVAISEGQWTMWWFSAQTPWGIVTYGKRPFNFGCGLQYNGAEDLTSESLLLVAPTGPLRIGVGFYPWRQQPDNPFRQDQPNNSIPQTTENPYFNPLDTNAVLALSPTAFITFDAGPISVGMVAEYFSFHRGPESQRSQIDRASFPTSDVVGTDGGIFLKYNNGRYFLNAELDWVNKTTKFQRSLNGTFLGTPDRADGTGSLFAPRYIEAWRWMVETGLMAGPIKASFIYAWLPGPDRRHGVVIDRQPYFYGFANNGLFMPYSLVMNFYYGGGLNLFNLNTDGYLNDASILAARLDYAAASNLNLFGSFCWFDRASAQGYGWGFMRPGPTGTTVQFQNLSTINAATTGAPSIPDNNLGWEIDAGIDWQLLDKWTVRMAAGYWQPGRWFNYACIDKTVPNWDNPSPANQFGINPNRVIDPVTAIKVFVIVEF
ncbi:MAG: hypothetical protein HY913_14465 [Desulfomonile tiedjei]|nr:hypothetical protein [Desulfomonile tiedjei]